jgi:tryptophan-rich sensory protein
MEKIIAYLRAFVAMVIVMFIPNTVTMDAVKSSWYERIRPALTPPNYVFPIVWTILYILIGIALAQTLLLTDSVTKTVLLWLYLFNLSMNVLWSLVYFGNRDVLSALFILLAIVTSTVFILYYTYLTLPIWVFAILIPYQAWILFAAFLNTSSALK